MQAHVPGRLLRKKHISTVYFKIVITKDKIVAAVITFRVLKTTVQSLDTQSGLPVSPSGVKHQACSPLLCFKDVCCA